MGIFDDTNANALQVTIQGEPLKHLLFHYRLVFSGWSYAQIVQGGESFDSLSQGLQNALWRCGGSPKNVRSDSLSAAFNNHHEEMRLTERYEALCQKYNLNPLYLQQNPGNNKGVAHENGSIESPNGHLKRRLEQQLLKRESRDFDSLTDYQEFIDALINSINQKCEDRFSEERTHLQPLPEEQEQTFSQKIAKVSSSSTIQFARVTYTVPSRLIGHTVMIHAHPDRLELFYAQKKATTLPRLYSKNGSRPRRIEYRHIIHSLSKKPNAFRNSQFRDDLIPAGDFTLLWQGMKSKGLTDEYCHFMVKLLPLAAEQDCEQALGRFVLDCWDENRLVTIKECKEKFENPRSAPSEFICPQHALGTYDPLLNLKHQGGA